MVKILKIAMSSKDKTTKKSRGTKSETPKVERGTFEWIFSNSKGILFTFLISQSFYDTRSIKWEKRINWKEKKEQILMQFLGDKMIVYETYIVF